MSFILSGDDEIRSLSNDFNSIELLLYEPGSQILGVDIDMKKKHIYWTSGTRNLIYFRFS